jgi:hypothetical protein
LVVAPFFFPFDLRTLKPVSAVRYDEIVLTG